MLRKAARGVYGPAVFSPWLRTAARGAVYGVCHEERVAFGPWLLCEAARGVYDLLHSAGVVFGPWLLCEAARKVLPFLSFPPLYFFFLVSLN